MLNPGYEIWLGGGDIRPWDPPLDRDMSPALVDYVFSEKLFVTFLVNGCIKPTPQNALLSEIATNNPWPRPIGVYGYANYWLVFGGFLFEAQTRCLDSRNMGAIPSETTNFSFHLHAECADCRARRDRAERIGGHRIRPQQDLRGVHRRGRGQHTVRHDDPCRLDSPARRLV